MHRDRADPSQGYAIRGESKTGPNTQISFVTTGVILRRLSAGGDADLDGVSHIVVDEVHERSVDSDFLLLQLRELLERNKKIKVGGPGRFGTMLTPAGHSHECHYQPTNIHRYVAFSSLPSLLTRADYFGGAPALEIPGFTHPVQDL